MIEIIPRPIKEIPNWQKFLFYFLVVLVIVLIIIYFVLGSFQKRSQNYLQTLEKKLSEGKTPQMVELEEGVFSSKTKIDEFSPFLKEHILGSKFFSFLENKTHPRIFFPKINLNSKTSRVALIGVADSFLSLGQQLLILDQDVLVESLGLSDVSLRKKGGIGFNLNISLNEKLFRY